MTNIKRELSSVQIWTQRVRRGGRRRWAVRKYIRPTEYPIRARYPAGRHTPRRLRRNHAEAKTQFAVAGRGKNARRADPGGVP